jgi:imidazolonepropionase-like amidohydrolase
MSRHAVALSCVVLPSLCCLAWINARPDEKAPDESVLAFKGATVHTAAGPKIDNGVLVVHKGKVVAVGDASTAIPKGAKVIDATGKTIIPGLVDSHSHVAIFGRPGVTAHADGNEGSGPVQSGLRALDAINPDDVSVRMALAGGVTCANVMPGSGNVIGGETLYVKFRGTTVEEMRIVGDVLGGLKMANGENPKNFNFTRSKAPPGTRMKLAALQREQFVKAREYKKKRDAAKKAKDEGKETPEPERDVNLDALVEVLERKRTVHFHCHRADDLMSALRLAKEFDFEIVLQHATEGYRVAKELAARKVGVSLTLVDSPGGKLEVMGLMEENAALLAKAGVKVAINTDDPVTESRFYLRTGSIALRGGMTEEQALKALTIHPAEMLHLEKRVGSLEKGKDADFVVLSGAPFSVYTQVLQTYVDGKPRYDRTRHRDWTYQAGGFAVLDEERRPPTPPLIKAPSAVTTPDVGKLPHEAARRSDKTFAIVARRIHTASGETIEHGVILVQDGLIAAVGSQEKVKLPKDIRILPAAVVTPGLIDANSCVGISGGYNVAADQDQDEKTDPNQADLRVLDAFNPDETLVDFVRREGVTTLHVVPGRVNAIAGQSAIFTTKGVTADSMALRTPAGVLVNLGEAPKGAYPNKLPTTRMGTAALLRTALNKAKNYNLKRSGKEKPPEDAKSEALALALQRKVPVFFAAHRADDILTALRIAKEFNLDARLTLATEAYLVADEIAKAKVPVILHPTMQRIGGNMETLNSQLSTARVLAEKKIPFAIGTGFEGYVPKTRVLRSEAAMAAVNGLGHEQALAAITINAAKILGIEKTRGSIEKGKVADLVLYDGDCFEHSTHVTYTIVNGRMEYDRAEIQAIPFARRALPIVGGGEPNCCLGVW